MTLGKEVDVIVTRPRGSWRWQDAFAVSTYRRVKSKDGRREIWKFISRGRKMSRPQLGELWDQLPHGRPK